MNILFCNISWMKQYQGITDDDKPKYRGNYLSEQDAANDIFNFSEYNGRCYGYVRHEGELTPPAWLEDASAWKDRQTQADLVVWCAFKDRNTARIVGWYRDAVLHRDEQYRPSFTNPDYELDYFIETESKNAFLLPENSRTFRIDSADRAGKGKGFGKTDVWFAESEYARKELVPAVLEYIRSYTGPRGNFVLTDGLAEALPADMDASVGQEELLREAVRRIENEDFTGALSYCNAALKPGSTPEILYTKAYCLYSLSAFDKARELLEKCRAQDPANLRITEMLAFCSDMAGDWDDTLVYLEELLEGTREEESRDAIRDMIAEIRGYVRGES